MSELALRLIAENKKTRATFLDLGNCDLTEVPDEIGELVWLEGLSLSSVWSDNDSFQKSQNNKRPNNISRIGNQIGYLKRLKKLFIVGWYDKKYDLVDLGPLSELTALQQLDVSDTQISDLDPLAKLTDLQQLNVSFTQIIDLGPLTKLTALQKLNIRYTEISDLSPLVKLTAMEQLDVSQTIITTIRPLAKLTALQTLDASYTNITSIS